MSSRVVVKGLPKYVDTKRLREHFAAFAEVTDAKVITKNGDSRRFGFVGFKSSKDASRARKYFDQTFVDTCKVSVEAAMPVGDAAIPRPWSKHSKGSSAYTRLNEDEEDDQSGGKQTAREAKKKVSERKDQAKDKHKKSDAKDKKWAEFLEVANPRSKSTLWSNDTGQAVAEEVENKKPGGAGLTVKRTRIKFGGDEESGADEGPEDGSDSTDDDEYDEVKGSPQQPVGAASAMEEDDDAYLKSKMTDDFSDSDDDDSEEEEEEKEEEEKEEEEDVSGEEEEEEVTKKKKKKATAKKVKSLLSEDEDEDEDEKPAAAKKKKGKGGTNVSDEADDIAESGRLFIRNLSYAVTEAEVAAFFGKQGPIAEVHLPIDSITKQNKGMAYVLFMMPAHAVAAQTKLDGTIFQGRLMHVLPAKAQKQTVKPEGGGPKGFKADKEQERKANANSEHNWNSLFLNQDAVVASMEDSHGLSKAEVLDPESSNMAVRVALGETHAIASTKSFLEENGVNVAAFTEDGAKKKPRSASVIMVKNLPADTDESELRQLFGKHGSLNTLVLAPSRALALAEFLEPSEARTAFRSLAYTRFKHVPLYLEWAPATAMKEKPAEKSKAEKKAEKAEEESAAVQEEPDLADDDISTLYVTNLSFDTKEASLLKAVNKKVKGVRAVTIATKPDPKGGEALSRGFGFLEFSSKAEAGSALLQLQGVDIDGHNIKLKMSTRTSATQSGSANNKKKKDTGATTGKKSDTKVIVRNMPFEATKKELQQLFHTFGQVRSVRVPRKFDGSHRGFAFVDFLSKEEAKNAVQSLEGTHLYGRHLVIEFADVDESIELIRNKAKRDLESEEKHEGAKKKKSKKNQSSDPLD